MKPRRYATSLLALFALACVACGQKPGVALLPDPRASLGGGLVLPEGASVDPETGQIVDSAGNVIGSVDDLAAGSASAELASAGGSVAGGQSDPAADASQSDGTAAPAAPADEKSVGAGSVIKIGAHAPLTGAAPIPSDSAEKGNDLYYKWLKEQGKDINGRQVEALLRNDNYNPSQAVAVCKEMVEKDNVFLLYGFAGTDQIQACARYAASAGVPYLSAGVTEAGLTTAPTYFAVSLSYAEQGSLLVDFMDRSLKAKAEKNGMLRFDTPNFDDAHASFVEAMKRKGLPLTYDRAITRQASQAEAQTVVQEMKAQG